MGGKRNRNPHRWAACETALCTKGDNAVLPDRLMATPDQVRADCIRGVPSRFPLYRVGKAREPKRILTNLVKYEPS